MLYNYNEAGLYNDHNYYYYTIVAASCMTEDEVRLIDGFSESEGQLQICKNQYWRDVCSSSSRGYETNLGIVACRQLGYTDTCKSALVCTCI